MPDRLMVAPRCESCGKEGRPGYRFCPNCGYSSGGSVAAAADILDPADRAANFRAQWTEIRRIGLLFSLLLFVSFLTGLVGRSFAGPRLEVLAEVVMAALAILFAMPHLREIARLLRLPSARRRHTLEMVTVGLGLVAFLSAYFSLFRWLGFQTIKMAPPFIKAAWPLWSMYLAVSVLPAVVEELTFRGVIQTSLEQVFSQRDALLIQAALFSTLHLLPSVFLSHFAMGLCFGYLRNRARSVYPGMLVHAAWNALVVFRELHPGWVAT